MISRKDLVLFHTIGFLNACVFMIPVWYFFFTTYLDFGISQAIFITVFWNIIAAIFEVPSGAWADRYGRKKMYILGGLFTILSFSLYFIGTEFWHFILITFLNGLGMSMTSGNIEAIIHDKIGNIKNGEESFNKILSHQYIFLFLGRAISSLFAGYLFLLHPLFPIVGTISAYSILLCCFFFINTSDQTKSEAKNNTIHIKETLSWLYTYPLKLYILIFLTFLLTGIGNIYWFSYQAFLEIHNFQILHIGIIYFFISIFSALGSYSVGKLQKRYDSFDILRILFFVLLLISFMFVFLRDIYVVFPIFLLSYIFGFMNPLGKSYLIKNASPEHKSTIFSIFSLTVSLTCFLLPATSGVFAEYYSLEIVYLFLVFIILFIILLDNLYIRKKLKI